MKIPIKITTYIIEAIIGILILGVIIFILQGIQKDSQELISIKKELASLSQQEKDLENLQKKYEIYQQNLEKINNFFIDSTFPVEFVQFLKNSASDAHISMKISLATEIKEPEPALSYNTTLAGSFANLLKFIDKLENGPYLIEINSLNVKEFAQESSDNIMANLVLIILAQ